MKENAGEKQAATENQKTDVGKESAARKFFVFFSEPRLITQGVSFMVLAAFAAAYFLWYVPDRRERLSKRNFRVLATSSEQIKFAIEALPSALTFAARSVESDERRGNP